MLYWFSPNYTLERAVVVYTLTVMSFIILLVKKYKITLTILKSVKSSVKRLRGKFETSTRLYINSHKKRCDAILAALFLWFLGMCLGIYFEGGVVFESSIIAFISFGIYLILKCILFFFNNLTEVLDNKYLRISLKTIYFIEMYFIVFGSYILNGLPSYNKEKVVERGLNACLSDFELFFFYLAYSGTAISIVCLLVIMAAIVFKYKIIKKSIMNKLKFILFVYLQFTVLFTALVVFTNFLFGDFPGLMRTLTMADICNVAYKVVISSVDITVFSNIVKTVFGKIDVILMVISNLTFIGIFIGMLLEDKS